MASLSEVRLENGYLHVRFEGRATRLHNGLERALDAHRARIVDFCRENECHKVLLDLTSVDGGIGILEEHLAACVIIKEWPPNSQVALVPSPGYFPDKGEHLEKVARNRGASLRLFEDIEDAKNWLVSPYVTRNIPA